MSFSAIERAALRAVPGVGPAVIARLEGLGFDSFALLSQADAREIVVLAAAQTGSTCWKNSPQARTAIRAAIALAQSHLQAEQGVAQ